MTPEPRQAPVAARPFEAPKASNAHGQTAFLIDEQRDGNARDVEPDWDELKDNATD